MKKISVRQSLFIRVLNMQPKTIFSFLFVILILVSQCVVKMSQQVSNSVSRKCSFFNMASRQPPFTARARSEATDIAPGPSVLLVQTRFFGIPDVHLIRINIAAFQDKVKSYYQKVFSAIKHQSTFPFELDKTFTCFILVNKTLKFHG